MQLERNSLAVSGLSLLTNQLHLLHVCRGRITTLYHLLVH